MAQLQKNKAMCNEDYFRYKEACAGTHLNHCMSDLETPEKTLSHAKYYKGKYKECADRRETYAIECAAHLKPESVPGGHKLWIKQLRKFQNECEKKEKKNYPIVKEARRQRYELELAKSKNKSVKPKNMNEKIKNKMREDQEEYDAKQVEIHTKIYIEEAFTDYYQILNRPIVAEIIQEKIENKKDTEFIKQYDIIMKWQKTGDILPIHFNFNFTELDKHIVNLEMQIKAKEAKKAKEEKKRQENRMLSEAMSLSQQSAKEEKKRQENHMLSEAMSVSQQSEKEYSDLILTLDIILNPIPSKTVYKRDWIHKWLRQ